MSSTWVVQAHWCVGEEKRSYKPVRCESLQAAEQTRPLVAIHENQTALVEFFEIKSNNRREIDAGVEQIEGRVTDSKDSSFQSHVFNGRWRPSTPGRRSWEMDTYHDPVLGLSLDASTTSTKGLITYDIGGSRDGLQWADVLIRRTLLRAGANVLTRAAPSAPSAPSTPNSGTGGKKTSKIPAFLTPWNWIPADLPCWIPGAMPPEVLEACGLESGEVMV